MDMFQGITGTAFVTVQATSIDPVAWPSAWLIVAAGVIILGFGLSIVVSAPEFINTLPLIGG